MYPSRYEGFGLPVAEAMRCGLPVITSNVSSLPEVAGDAAITIDPENADELAAAMLLVLEQQPERLHLMREQGLRQGARFTWEQTAARTAEVYDRILNHPHG